MEVAAKIFQSETMTHEERIALAEHEYAVVGNLTHENIIRCHGLLVQPNVVCILQELALDGDLFNVLDEGFGLPTDKAVKYVTTLAPSPLS